MSGCSCSDTYAEFKSKLVLEVLEGVKSINEIASHYEVLPANLKNWKNQFIENMSLAFDKSAVVKEYKTEIESLEANNQKLAQKVGNLTIEKDFLEGKLVSSVSSDKRKAMIDTGHSLSLLKQCQLLQLNRTGLYYTPIPQFSTQADIKILNEIDEIYTESPCYGYRRMHKQLIKDGFSIGTERVAKAMKFMGIKVIYPMPKTTITNKEHKKYPYLLNQFKNEKNQVVVEKVNQVWSTDITYIKLEKGFTYLAAVIDWNSKNILSWKLSNTMDISLTTGVLQAALDNYPKPEIFNTDQVSSDN
jgi:putative transposase